jgi:hypothetical protein
MRRALAASEVGEASYVFGGSLAYDKIRVVEGAGWTNALARLGALLQGEPPLRGDNGVGLGNRVYFPRTLGTNPEDLRAGRFEDMAWLIHELTHCWQFQKFGPRYVLEALHAQLTLGRRAYDFGGEEGLKKALEEGRRLADFNREQQGDIARGYYRQLKRGLEVSAWEPFVQAFREAGRS